MVRLKMIIHRKDVARKRVARLRILKRAATRKSQRLLATASNRATKAKSRRFFLLDEDSDFESPSTDAVPESKKSHTQPQSITQVPKVDADSVFVVSDSSSSDSEYIPVQTSSKVEKKTSPKIGMKRMIMSKKHYTSYGGPAHTHVLKKPRRIPNKVKIEECEVKKECVDEVNLDSDSGNNSDCSIYYPRLESRGSPLSLVKVMTRLSEEQRKAVQELGFGSILELGVRQIPRALAYWLVHQFNSVNCSITLPESRIIHISAVDVYYVFDFPMGKRVVPEKRQDLYAPGFTEWRDSYGHEKFAGNNIRPSDIGDRMMKTPEVYPQFTRDFILMVISVLADFGVSRFVSLSYFDALEDMSRIHEFNWCQFVVMKLIDHKEKYELSSKASKANPWFGGPILFLVLLYLDRMEIRGPSPIPRVIPTFTGWTSEFIRKIEQFEMDNGGFGKGYLLAPPIDAPDSIFRSFRPAAQRPDASKGKRKVEEEDDDKDGIKELCKLGRDVINSVVGFRDQLSTKKKQHPHSMTLKRLEKAFKEMVGCPSSPLSEENPDEGEDSFWGNKILLDTIDAFTKVIIDMTPTKPSPENKKDKDPIASRFDIGNSSQEINTDSGFKIPAVPGTVTSTELDKSHPTSSTVHTPISLNRAAELRFKDQRDPIAAMFDIGISSQEINIDSGFKIPAIPGTVTSTELDKSHSSSFTVHTPVSFSQVVELRNKDERGIKLPAPLVSPFCVRVTDVTSPLKSDEKMIFRWLLANITNEEISDAKRKELMYIKYGDTSVLKHDLETLDIGSEVDVSVINAWCNYVNHEEVQRNPDSASRFCFSVDTSRKILVDANDTIVIDQIKFELNHYPKLKIKIEDTDLVFFTVILGKHFFDVCIDRKKPSVDIIDNLISDYTDNEQYGKVVYKLRDIYANLIEDKNIKLANKIRKLVPKRISLPWASNSNVIDCGIFSMFHLEAYIGVSKWKSVLKKDCDDQLDKLRVRYAYRLITSKRNELWPDIEAKIIQFFQAMKKPLHFKLRKRE